VLEKESIVRKKRETKRFFKDMEANIINKVYILNRPIDLLLISLNLHLG
jgi:hypothetical protein